MSGESCDTTCGISWRGKVMIVARSEIVLPAALSTKHLSGRILQQFCQSGRSSANFSALFSSRLGPSLDCRAEDIIKNLQAILAILQRLRLFHLRLSEEI